MKSITLVKLGGSIITKKSKEDTVDLKSLNIISKQVKEAQSLGYKLIIAHGQGSFAHRPAKKYQTYKGIINKKSFQGLCEVASKASQLNRIVVDYFLEQNIKAFSVNPSSIMVSNNHKPYKLFTETIEELLKNNLTPILYGDQIIDRKIGCTIFSAEQVLNSVANKLQKKYKIDKIIHCSDIEGVYDKDKKIIKEINSKNFRNFKKNIKNSKEIDVTGGMIHKVEQSLEIAKKGINSCIINGRKNGNLLNAIERKENTGTTIVK